MWPTVILVQCFRPQEDSHVLVVAFVSIGTPHAETNFGVFFPDVSRFDILRKCKLCVSIPLLHHKVQHFVLCIGRVGNDSTFHRRSAAVKIPKIHLLAYGIVFKITYHSWGCEHGLYGKYGTNE